MTPIPPLSDEEKAFHEAGHAIVAHLLGYRVIRIQLDPKPRVDIPELELDVANFNDAERDDRRKRLVVRYAGHVSQFYFSGVKDEVNSRADFKCNEWNATLLADDGDAAQELLDKSMQDAQQLLKVSHHWKAVQELARELVKRRNIEGEELRIFLVAVQETKAGQAGQDE
jgi:ATP-dependent Zn protease